MSVSSIILSQLGGNRFLAMTGAKSLVAGESMLQFSIPKSKGINKVRISLNEHDLYNVSFYNIKGIDCDVVEAHFGIDCEGLVSLFERSTGLYTSL
jgi:hypothetical protein